MASGDKSSSPGRQVLRERLEVGETGAPAGHSAVVRGPKPDIDFEKVGASSLLNRLDSFLPSMRTANEELKRKIEMDGPESVNLLVVPEGEQHIEMNLQFGEVPDALDPDAEESDVQPATAERGAAALAAADRAVAGASGGSSAEAPQTAGITVLPSNQDSTAQGPQDEDGDQRIN